MILNTLLTYSDAIITQNTSSIYENCYFNISTELFEIKYCKYHSGEYSGQLCETNCVQLYYSVFRNVLQKILYLYGHICIKNIMITISIRIFRDCTKTFAPSVLS